MFALLPAPLAAADEAQVTIGYLPLATRSSELLVRGTAPQGSVVLLSVNGEPVLRVYASREMAVYRGIVPLQPGWNRITAQLEGTEATATASLYYVTRSFTDVQGDPLQDDIEILATLGIVEGDGTGAFRPGDPLTRAQVAKLLTLALGLEPGDPSVLERFTDAAAIPEWARPYVAAVCQAGMVRGYPDGSFQPNRSVTRAELVALAERAVPPSIVGSKPAIAYPDAIADWVKPSADRAARLGLIESFWGERFRGTDPVPREQLPVPGAFGLFRGGDGTWRIVDTRCTGISSRHCCSCVAA